MPRRASSASINSTSIRFGATLLRPAATGEPVSWTFLTLPKEARLKLPECNTARTATAGRQTHRRRPGWAEPEVVFRIVHVADADGQPPVACRDQVVEVGLGPNPAFATNRVGSFTRRVPTGRVVTGAPPRRGKPRPRKVPQPPRVAALLRKAQAWRTMLESGEVANQAEIARREGVTRARVTQVLGLLRLIPAIQTHVLSLPRTGGRSGIPERALRLLASLCPDEQLPEFATLLDAASKGPKQTARSGEVATGRSTVTG